MGHDRFFPHVFLICGYKIFSRNVWRKHAALESWHMWVDNIKIHLKGLDLSGLGQGQIAISYEYDNEPSGSIKVGTFLD